MLKRAEYGLPLLWFFALLGFGASLGLTDDEAYYWVLAQRPALGYAFHPPMVAWLIGLAQFVFGGLFGTHSAGLVRLPAALCSAGMLALALNWIRNEVDRARVPQAFAILLSFAGLFALSWMMVPDLPLFLGWTLAFTTTWTLCFRPCRLQVQSLALGAGIALAILSKFSGVLPALSAGIAVLVWAPRERRLPALFAVAVGGLLAALPILIWNAQHEWASILYQIRDRHEGGGGLSWVRFARFWAVEWVAAGPVLVAYAGWILFESWRSGGRNRRVTFAAVWIAPALLFCVQPLWAEFKPHWAFIVWWPALLVFAAEGRRFARVQISWGFSLLAVVVLFSLVPLGRLFSKDPKLDVTNDLYGWADLPAYLKTLPGPLPTAVVGSRYQTASQAAFALAGSEFSVTFLPRDLKSKEEWPDLRVSTHQGPAWPALLAPLLYVLDNRYDAGPEFPGAACQKLGRLEKLRGQTPAKWIEVWKCVPGVVPS